MARDGGVDSDRLADRLAAPFAAAGGDSASGDLLGLQGLHVRARLAQGTSTEREILDGLRAAILTGAPLPGALPPPPARAPGPPAAGVGAGAETSSGCPAALGLFFKGLSAAATALPYAVVGGIFYQADAIYPAGGDDTGAELDAIAAQLDQLQARMAELKLGLAELAKLLSDANAKTVLARMRDDVGALDGLIDAYNMVTIRETPGFAYRSLRNYLDADGRSGLDARAETIPGEIVATRIKCNAMITQAVSFVVESHTQARVMLLDVTCSSTGPSGGLRALYCDVESPVAGERPSTLRGIKAWWIAGQAAPFIETHCDVR